MTNASATVAALRPRPLAACLHGYYYETRYLFVCFFFRVCKVTMAFIHKRNEQNRRSAGCPGWGLGLNIGLIAAAAAYPPQVVYIDAQRPMRRDYMPKRQSIVDPGAEPYQFFGGTAGDRRSAGYNWCRRTGFPNQGRVSLPSSRGTGFPIQGRVVSLPSRVRYYPSYEFMRQRSRNSVPKLMKRGGVR